MISWRGDGSWGEGQGAADQSSEFRVGVRRRFFGIRDQGFDESLQGLLRQGAVACGTGER